MTKVVLRAGRILRCYQKFCSGGTVGQKISIANLSVPLEHLIGAIHGLLFPYMLNKRYLYFAAKKSKIWLCV
jgi:mannitol-specific phosphotransferase system IIBC component